MLDPVLTILLMWHLGSVVLWFGSSVTFVLAVHPSLRDLDVVQGRAYLRSFLPKFSKLLGGAALSAAVAGLLLFGYVSSVTTSFTPTGWRFIFVSVGALLGLIAAILTLGVAVPLAGRFMDPSSQVSNGPRFTILDQDTMVKGLVGVMRSVVIFQSLAFVLMLMGAVHG